MIINGLGELTPEQVRSELEKYRIMNEARAKKGLAPIPVPENLQSGDVRFVTVGSSGGERSPMIQTTASEMGSTVATLQQFLASRSKEEPPPVVLGEPVGRRPRQAPKGPTVRGTPPAQGVRRPAGGSALASDEDKKKMWPWLAAAAGVGGLIWWTKRRRN